MASIPDLGWMIAVIATLFRPGAIWMLSGWQKQPKTQPQSQVDPAGESHDLSGAPEG